MIKHFAFLLALMLALPIGGMAAAQSGQQLIDQQRLELSQFQQQMQLQQLQQQQVLQQQQLQQQRIQQQVQQSLQR